MTEEDQQLNVIRYGAGSWLAAGTEGTLLMNYSDNVEENWETRTLPTSSGLPEDGDDSWGPEHAVNDAIYSAYTDTWYIVGDNAKIAKSYDDGEEWYMVPFPQAWDTINPSISCIEYSNPLNDDNARNLLLIGTEEAQIAYLDEDEESDVTPGEWTPLRLPIDGELDEEGYDPDADGEGDTDDGLPDAETPPVAEGWGDNAVLAIGYNDITDTWMVGGSEGRLAFTSTLLDPVRDLDPDEDDPNYDPVANAELPTSQWTMLGLPEEVELYNVTAIHCNDGVWVIGGEKEQRGLMLFSEDDGVSWTPIQLKDAETDEDDEFGVIYRIGWKPGEWIATSDSGT
ncbi:MAG: hypothetical protein LC687_08270, partial [Actinobacteria bacterium]|nr:hypothetical protein [Actinomycetota bacterium]